jgi:hypothetical protein
VNLFEFSGSEGVLVPPRPRGSLSTAINNEATALVYLARRGELEASGVKTKCWRNCEPALQEITQRKVRREYNKSVTFTVPAFEVNSTVCSAKLFVHLLTCTLLGD